MFRVSGPAKAFNEHLKQTEQQAERIEKIFSDLDGSPRGKKFVGMEGLIKEGNEAMKSAEKDAVDAALIAAAQKVEHYEISSYGTARTWAQRMGHDRAARILQETLEEESRTNEKLTQIAFYISWKGWRLSAAGFKKIAAMADTCQTTL